MTDIREQNNQWLDAWTDDVLDMFFIMRAGTPSDVRCSRFVSIRLAELKGKG